MVILIKRFKRQGIPDTEDKHLELICSILQRRISIILQDIGKTPDKIIPII